MREAALLAHVRGVVALPVPEIGGIAGHDPRLCDPVTHRYAICLNSPAFAKATGTEAKTADFTGLCYRTPASIGAYEVPDQPPCKCPGTAPAEKP